MGDQVVGDEGKTLFKHVRRYTTVEEQEKPDGENRRKYNVMKYVEENRDLYFVRLVAGRLKKKHTELIDIHQKEGDQYFYSYTTELQSAWADAMEECKLMLDSESRGFPPFFESEEFFKTYFLPKEYESLLVAFSRYVAYLMSEAYKRLVMKGNTRFEFWHMEESEDKLTMNILRAMAMIIRNDLRTDLVRDYLPELEYEG